MKRLEENREQAISVRPIASEHPEKSKAALDLQLKMVTSSINHEYARREYESCSDRSKKDDLTEYMAECRAEYFQARKALESIDPYAIVDFEADLMQQKKRMVEGLMH